MDTLHRFDRRASTYENSVLQQFLFGPVQHTALHLALQHLPQACRILDVGCGTGQLLRRARPCYPLASLVGIDLAGQMLATASAITPTKLSVQFIHARAEQLPFADAMFDLVFTTFSLRHWMDPPAGIAEIGRVLTWDGVLILADVFPRYQHPSPTVPRLRRRLTEVPTQLGSMLAPHRLAIIGCDRTRWFRLPDVQVIAARKTTTVHRAR
jgi:ubiquinone/menaquinone biosynthesis C-methylase UbiE